MMTFNIIGTKDPKIIIALNKLLKAFDRDDQIASGDSDFSVYIATVTFDKEIKAFLKCQDMTIERKIPILDDEAYDRKYLILACFYQLLEKLKGRSLSYGVLTGIRPTKLVHTYKARFSDEEVISILENKYLVSKEKAQLLLEVVNNQLEVIDDFNKLKHEVSIYLNIPYCLSRCQYCSFTSYPKDYQRVTQEQYIKTLTYEIKTLGEYLKDHSIKITTIYIGGGTPTALSDALLEVLLQSIKKHLFSEAVKEYTIECGRPDSLTESKLSLIKAYHVTRISINPQTFNDKTLQKMNRTHSVQDLYERFNEAKKLGFQDINMDLIIGLPGEVFDDYQYSIDETLKLNPTSVTIHYLAYKKGADLYKKIENRQKEAYQQAFSYAYQNLKKHQYHPYYLYRQKNIVGSLENIGYSKKGYVSLYNILMMEEAQTIIGLGCHASSKFLNYDLILNPKDLLTYVDSVKEYLDKKIESLKKTLRNDEVNFHE